MSEDPTGMEGSELEGIVPSPCPHLQQLLHMSEDPTGKEGPELEAIATS
jgi:hypothetical protein